MNRKIEQILEYTRLSPSSHNTQPWAVSVNENTINLFADFSRSLHFSDPDNRELYVSLGTALQNTLYAAEGLGNKYTVKAFPRGDNELVASISINGEAGKPDEEILNAMKNRKSNRNRYDDREISSRISSSWKELVKDLEVELHIIENKKEKSEAGELIAKGTIDAMKNQGFKNELSKWVRNNWTGSHDGMPCYGLNIPTIASFFAPVVLKYFNLGPMQAKQEKELIRSSPVVAVICGENNTSNWLRAGQAYERVTLDATRNDIKSATMTAAIEIGDYYKELMKILKTKKRPLVMFRLGYCQKEPKETPKRTVSEILKN